jgi:RimJ/RimL family protein N-acetyltransferase
MTSTHTPRFLFHAAPLGARELAAHEVPQLQALFDANPGYFHAVNGRPPHADEAQQEFDERPPEHLTFTRHWFLGLFEGETLQGVAVVVQDLGASGVWHIALYLLADSLHGSGAASRTCDALEDWMRSLGAEWVRLNVVVGNTRAERFWQKRGYQPLRRRDNVDTGGRINSVQLQAKPLTGGTLSDYLRRMPRDQPDSALP